MSKNTEEFRDIRKRLGLSQQAIAEFLGVSARTIYSWENEDIRAQGLSFEAAIAKLRKLERDSPI